MNTVDSEDPPFHAHPATYEDQVCIFYGAMVECVSSEDQYIGHIITTRDAGTMAA